MNGDMTGDHCWMASGCMEGLASAGTRRERGMYGAGRHINRWALGTGRDSFVMASILQ